MIRLGSKTSEREKNVTVVSTVTGCDVTNCATTLHGFNKHASSRREAVSDSRSVPRCTEKIPQIYACSHVSIVRLVRSTLATRLVTRFHRTSCQGNSSRSALSPYQACGEVEDVVGALTTVVGGVAQVSMNFLLSSGCCSSLRWKKGKRKIDRWKAGK